MWKPKILVEVATPEPAAHFPDHLASFDWETHRDGLSWFELTADLFLNGRGKLNQMIDVAPARFRVFNDDLKIYAAVENSRVRLASHWIWPPLDHHDPAVASTS
jgi:hypothetical protein